MKNLIFIVTAVVVTLTHGSESREWTSKDGNSTITATVVDIDNGKVVLKSDEGREVTVQISKLCKADQSYLETLAVVKSKEVLFIGNSYTYSQNMPEIIRVLAEEKGSELNYEMIAPGGVGFQHHLKSKETMKAIKSRHWDFIVLQDRSIAPLLMPEQVINFGAELVQISKKYSGEVLLYQTMAYGKRHGLMNGSSKMVDAMHDRITSTYDELARKTGAKVVPAGLAWRTSQRESPKIKLHEEDQSHPTKEGAYLTALLFYGVIFETNIENMSDDFCAEMHRNGKRKSIQISLNKEMRITLESVANQSIERTVKTPAD